MRVRTALLAAVLVLASCAGAPTQIVLVAETDLAIPAELDAIRVRVTDPDGTTMHDAVAPLGAGEPPPPRQLVLLHRGGPLGPLHLDVAAMLSGATVVHVERTISFEAGRTTTIHVRLARACRGVTCPTDRTCGDDGLCRPIAIDACDLDASVCADAAMPDAAVPDAETDAPPPDAGPTCTLSADAHLCGSVRDVHAVGDRITPMPCTPLPAGVTASYELRGPGGTLPGTAGWTVSGTGVYQLIATASAPAACSVSVSFHVQRFDMLPTTGRPTTTFQGFTAAVGIAFVATRNGPYAVTRAAGWRDLRTGTGATFSNTDLTGVGVRLGDAVFGTTMSHPPGTRVHAATDLSSIVLSNVAFPSDGADRSVRAIGVAPDGTSSGGGLGAIATRGGVLVLEDTPSPFATRALLPTYDVAVDVAVTSTEAATRGAVWSMDATTLHNHAVGSGAAIASGAAIPLGVAVGRALAVDDRTDGASRLAVCSADAGVRLYDLSAVGATLPAPLATVGGSCRDIALDADGSFWIAMATGLVRVDANGLDRARPAAAEGAPAAGVARVAVAWDPTGREVWALSDTGDVFVVTASAP